MSSALEPGALVGSLIDWLEGLPNDFDGKERASRYAAQLTELQPAISGDDTQRIAWLEGKVVNVRTPLRYGSADLFWASPDEDGEPSNIREQIDGRMAAEQHSPTKAQEAEKPKD